MFSDRVSTTVCMRREPQQVATPREEELVRQYLPLVHHAVASFRGRVPKHVNVDDLTSAAMVGLFRAARGYEADRGVPFGPYATTRIRGAVLDELRGADWASRSVRTKARALQQACDTISGGLLEAAAAAGLSADEARQVMSDVHRATLLSVESFLGDDVGGALPADDVTPERVLLNRERDGYLRDAVAALPERLRHVVVGSFFDERTMGELAAELGVSESRVSHMRAEAMSLISDAMTAALHADARAPQGAPVGVAARRRAAYCAKVASASDYRRRLDRSEPVGSPFAVAEAITA